MWTDRSDVLKELETGRCQQIILRSFSLHHLQHSRKETILDQESIVEVVVLPHAGSKESQGGETEMLVLSREEFGDVESDRGGEDEVL